jgi:hypothetical protein
MDFMGFFRRQNATDTKQTVAAIEYWPNQGSFHTVRCWVRIQCKLGTSKLDSDPERGPLPNPTVSIATGSSGLRAPFPFKINNHFNLSFSNIWLFFTMDLDMCISEKLYMRKKV